MIVRRAATIEDVDRMVALGATMHAESGYKSRPYIPAKLVSYGRSFLDNPKSGVLILAEDKGDVCGMMAGWALEAFFNDDVLASDMILYMRPDKRGGTTAIRMIREFERWAKEIGAREINICVTANINDDRAVKLYSALGYGQNGVSLRKEF